MRKLSFVMVCLAWVSFLPARADHQDLSLLVAPELVSSGLVAFLLPRFSLKTGVKVHAEPMGAGSEPSTTLQLRPGTGTPVLSGQGQIYGLTTPASGNNAAQRFFDWIMSDIGQRTIKQFAPDGVQMFTGAVGSKVVAKVATPTGNVLQGESLAYTKCGRCHVIGVRNRMKGIGSTPSFALLRSFEDWEDRFRTFYALNPHPSFTQIAGITDAFDQSRPPPISPLLLTQQEHDNIVAFTAGITPVDLGAPLVHQ